jgi:hypothetical protein
VERELREQLKDKKLDARQLAERRRERNKPILKGFQEWLETHTGSVPVYIPGEKIHKSMKIDPPFR